MIFQYFNLEYYIQIETDISSYAMSKVLSQLTFDYLTFNPLTFNQITSNFESNLSQSKNLVKNSIKSDLSKYYSIVYFFTKMISTET